MGTRGRPRWHRAQPTFHALGSDGAQDEILAQVAPLFILGLSWDRLTTPAALAGLVTGTAVYAGLLASGHSQLWNLHAGVVAMMVNVGVCIAVSKVGSSPSRLEPIHG